MACFRWSEFASCRFIVFLLRCRKTTSQYDLRSICTTTNTVLQGEHLIRRFQCGLGHNEPQEKCLIIGLSPGDLRQRTYFAVEVGVDCQSQISACVSGFSNTLRWGFREFRRSNSLSMFGLRDWRSSCALQIEYGCSFKTCYQVLTFLALELYELYQRISIQSNHYHGSCTEHFWQAWAGPK